MTNRKSHTRFRLLAKTVTLHDLEGQLCTLFQNTCVFRSNLNCSEKFEWRYLRDEDSSLWQYKLFPGDSGVIENVDFQGFRTLRLRHLWKWGQHYYIILFSPLSPFHWLQNTWHWITSNGHFMLNFHYYEPRFQQLGYILIVEPIYKIFLLHVTSRDLRKRAVIRRILRIRDRTADLS